MDRLFQRLPLLGDVRGAGVEGRALVAQGLVPALQLRVLVLGVLEPAFPGEALGDNGAEPIGPAQGVTLVLLTLCLRLGQGLPRGINLGAKLVDLSLAGLRIGAVVEGCLRLFHRCRCVGQIGVEGRQGSPQGTALGLEPGDFRFGARQFRLRAGQGAVSQL